MKRLLFFLCFLLSFSFIQTQQTTPGHCSGQVLDRESKSAIPYSVLRLPSRGEGCVADKDGRFYLSLAQAAPSDTVYVSMIGYAPLKMTVSQLTRQPNISMRPNPPELQEVRITAKKYRHFRVGNVIHRKGLMYGFFNGTFGQEAGTLMRIRDRPTRVDSVWISGKIQDADTALLRLNVYEIQGDSLVNVLRQPVNLTFLRDSSAKTVTVDLRPYNLYVQHDFVVALEVRDLCGGIMMMYGSMIGSTTYQRSFQKPSWTRVHAPAGIAAFVTAAER